MRANVAISEQLGVVAQLAPVSQGAGTVTVGPVDTKLHRRLLFVLGLGALTTATVDAKLQAAPTSGGTYVDVAGTAITQVTGSGGKVVLIELKAETLAAQGLGQFVRLSLTIGTAAVIVSVQALAGGGRYEPQSDFNIAGVAQIVSA